MTAQLLVVIPTLGTRPQWLRMAVRSIAEQPNVSLRIRIVSRTAIEPVANEARGVSIQYVVHKEKGLSAAINRGFEDADEAFVTWLGDDDLLSPGTLAASIDALARHPKSPFVYGRTRYIDVNGETVGFTRPTRFAQDYLRFGKNFIPQPGSVLRASDLARVGGLRLDLANSMDLNMFIALRKLGRGVYRPVELAAYRLHSESITVSKGQNEEAEGVRSAHLGALASTTRWLWRPFTRVADRLLDKGTRSLPIPPIPHRGGAEYTRP
jgi:GT2 family glycosyltransferase